MKFLAITACPSGVAHTYMAAEAITKACKEKGIECKVETQGSIGVENEITEEDIKNADCVILTKDMPIKKEERFENLPKVRIQIKDAVKNAPVLIQKVEAAMLNHK